MHNVDGQRTGAEKGDDETECSHNRVPPVKLLFYLYYKSNKCACQEKIEQKFYISYQAVDLWEILY